MFQSKYVWKLLTLFGFHDCKPLSTPVEPGLHLSMHDAGEPVDRSKYDVAVGCLIWLASNTRADIQFVVSQVSRYMHSPGS